MARNPNKLSPHETRKNREQFIEWYDKKSSVKLTIQNHACPVIFGFNKADIDSRSEALDAYLISLKKGSWATTLLSELVFEEMLRHYMGDVFQKNGLQLFSTPTSLDQSRGDNTPWDKFGGMSDLTPGNLKMIHDGKVPFDQKGIDLILANEENVAICGIDITLGSHSTIQNKRRRYRPLNPIIAAPTFVLPIQHLQVGKQPTFPNTIDSVVRKNILLKGNLGIRDLTWDCHTVKYLKSHISNGIHATRNSLQEDMAFASYPYADAVYSKLDFIEDLFCSALE